MPTYGYFRMVEHTDPLTLEELVCAARKDVEPVRGEPVRTWTADYIVSKGGLIQFWNRCYAGEKSDTLIGSALLEKGYTICDVVLTNGTESKTDGLAKANHRAEERAAAASK